MRYVRGGLLWLSIILFCLVVWWAIVSNIIDAAHR